MSAIMARQKAATLPGSGPERRASGLASGVGGSARGEAVPGGALARRVPSHPDAGRALVPRPTGAFTTRGRAGDGRLSGSLCASFKDGGSGMTSPPRCAAHVGNGPLYAACMADYDRGHEGLTQYVVLNGVGGLAMRSYDETLWVLVENIRRRRRQLGITQVALARRMGLSSETSLTSLELGRHSPSLRTMCRIAAALETDLCSLLLPATESLSTPCSSGRSSHPHALSAPGTADTAGEG
ncbi:MAG: XRE family transcriptional regulator [Gammaproteobacteria bacterium]|nr:XRE family transcriptional regulator [Gammaproteobacteria bacterium]